MSSLSPKPVSSASASSGGRFHFIDWYRGVACVLMFQTHAYDAWTRDPYRQGFFWELARMQLGGFPARMFLFLTGVSLVLRYSANIRKGVPEWEARVSGIKRGFEVLLYGLAFRFAEWIFGGASLVHIGTMFKVDILNCIGVSLMLSGLCIGPVHLKGRVPILTLLLIPAIVVVTPLLQAIPYPHWLPPPLGAYLWDANPMGSFPLFPWLSYTLTGCVVGIYWMRMAERNKLGRAMVISALFGGVMAICGQLVPRLGLYIYYPTPAVPVPAYPISYVYRTGMCLLIGALSYYYCLRVPLGRFSPLLLLGQASLLVYIVHIEMVYGGLSWPIRHRLSLGLSTVLIVILTGLMIALAYYRVEIFGRRRMAAKVPRTASA